MATVGVKGLITGTGETCSALKERTVFSKNKFRRVSKETLTFVLW